MSKCSVCGTEQKQTGETKLSFDGVEDFAVPTNNINLSTMINGKQICEHCMNTYHTIDALLTGENYLYGSKMYYCNGRQLIESEGSD